LLWSGGGGITGACCCSAAGSALAGKAMLMAAAFHTSTATQALACQCLSLTFGISNWLLSNYVLAFIRPRGVLSSNKLPFPLPGIGSSISFTPPTIPPGASQPVQPQ